MSCFVFSYFCFVVLFVCFGFWESWERLSRGAISFWVCFRFGRINSHLSRPNRGAFKKGVFNLSRFCPPLPPPVCKLFFHFFPLFTGRDRVRSCRRRSPEPSRRRNIQRSELLRGSLSGTLQGVNPLAKELGMNHKTVRAALRRPRGGGAVGGSGAGAPALPPDHAPPALRVAILDYESRHESDDDC